MMTFGWYTVCVMSTLTICVPCNSDLFIMCGPILMPQHDHRTWQFLNMGQNFTPNSNLFAVTTSYLRLTTDLAKNNSISNGVKFDTSLSISFLLFTHQMVTRETILPLEPEQRQTQFDTWNISSMPSNFEPIFYPKKTHTNTQFHSCLFTFALRKYREENP